MITKTSLTILMSLLSFCLFSQNNKISSIVKKIERSGGYFSKYVGYAGSPSEEYELYLKLKKRASIEDLTRLSYHNDPIVRSYVSLALSEKMTQDEFFPIVLDRLNDTASVTTMSGCIISTDIVGDIFVRNFYRKNSTYKKLDSLLFFGDYLIYSDDNIRYSGGYKKDNREKAEKRLLDLAENGDLSSIQGLLKSGNVQYERFLDTLLRKSTSLYLRNVTNFGISEKYKSTLQRLAKEAQDYTGGFKSEWRLLYEYIARYKDKWASDLLYRPLLVVGNNKIQKYHAEFIGDAIDVNESQVYKDVAVRLFSEYKIISPSNYKYLINHYKSEQELLRIISANFRDLSVSNTDYSDNGRYEYAKRIVGNDFDFSNAFLEAMIEDSNIHDFQKIVLLIDDDNFISVSEDILSLLETEKNIYYHHAILERLSKLKLSKTYKSQLKEKFYKNIKIKESWGFSQAEEYLNEIL